jgi:hypothetical protein
MSLPEWLYIALIPSAYLLGRWLGWRAGWKAGMLVADNWKAAYDTAIRLKKSRSSVSKEVSVVKPVSTNG